MDKKIKDAVNTLKEVKNILQKFSSEEDGVYMANENNKDFNARMNDSKDMPKIVNIDEEASKK